MEDKKEELLLLLDLFLRLLESSNALICLLSSFLTLSSDNTLLLRDDTELLRLPLCLALSL